VTLHNTYEEIRTSHTFKQPRIWSEIIKYYNTTLEFHEWVTGYPWNYPECGNQSESQIFIVPLFKQFSTIF